MSAILSSVLSAIGHATVEGLAKAEDLTAAALLSVSLNLAFSLRSFMLCRTCGE
jgi:hypothetical protein